MIYFKPQHCEKRSTFSVEPDKRSRREVLEEGGGVRQWWVALGDRCAENRQLCMLSVGLNEDV